MCFLIKKIYDDDKKIYLFDDFLCQIEILLLNILKLFKIPSFLFKIPGFSMFEKKNLKLQFFLRVPCKKATLTNF